MKLTRSMLDPYVDEITQMYKLDGIPLEDIKEWLHKEKGVEVETSTIYSFVTKSVPKAITKMAEKDDDRWLKVFNREIDIIDETHESYAKLNALADKIEGMMADADSKGDKKELKSAISLFLQTTRVSREYLSTMMSVIEKIEVFNNYKKFFAIISEAIKREAPEDVADAIFRRIRKEISHDNIFNL